MTTRWRGACGGTEALGDGGADLGERGRSGAGAGDDDRDDRLPPLGVGHADDAHLADPRQARDDRLDRGGRRP